VSVQTGGFLPVYSATINLAITKHLGNKHVYIYQSLLSKFHVPPMCHHRAIMVWSPRRALHVVWRPLTEYDVNLHPACVEVH